MKGRSKSRRMKAAGLLSVQESREIADGDLYNVIATPDRKKNRIKKTSSSSSISSSSDSDRRRRRRRKNKTEKVLRSSVVNSRMSVRLSMADQFAVPMYEEDTSFMSAGDKKEKLYALRDVVESVANDGYIDRETFATTFEVHDSEYDEYDFDSEGNIDVNALLVDACMDTDMEEQDQLRFIFDLFDTNGRGKINRKQIKKLLKTSLTQAKLDVVGMDFNSLSKILLERLGKRENDYISYEEFQSVFKTYMSDTYADQAAAGMDPSTMQRSKFDEFCDTNKLRILWLMIYAALNVVAFLSKYYKYDFDPAVGLGLRIARGCAQVIMLNFFLVLLPMCRSIIAVLKSNNTLWQYIPFDDNIEFHKLCGIVLLTNGFIHTGAHISNEIHLYLIATDEEFSQSRFAEIPAFENGLPPFTETLGMLPIWTGILLFLIALIAFPLAAIPKFRQNRFNLFWYSHMLFGPFLILGSIHGALSWLAKSQSYWWIGPPFLIYLLERRFRYAKIFTQPVRIVRAELMEGTLGLFMEKPQRFVYRPGMYLFLNVPSLSLHEWHPFTISSAPGNETISVHIRNAGDWTGALHKLIGDVQSAKKPYPPVYLDGPVGAPTQDYQRYKTIMMIGGGIGVTPFASILKDTVHLWNQYRCKECKHIRHPRNFCIQKMYFHWVTRAQDSLRWFEETMNDVADLDRDNVIESHHYLTSVKNQDHNLPLKMFQAFVHDETGKDFVSGLRSKQITHFGRPNWDVQFQAMQKAHPGEAIGVFFCGPHALDKILAAACAKYSSDPNEGGTYFDYHSEKFS